MENIATSPITYIIVIFGFTIYTIKIPDLSLVPYIDGTITTPDYIEPHTKTGLLISYNVLWDTIYFLITPRDDSTDSF